MIRTGNKKTLSPSNSRSLLIFRDGYTIKEKVSDLDTNRTDRQQDLITLLP